MKRLRKIFKAGAVLLFVAVIIAGAAIFLSGPKLPDNTDEIIDAVMASDLPELLEGETGYVEVDGVRIWYESIMPDRQPKAAVLLFMGISNDALGWPPDFIDALVDEGYQVIRYDYRGTGLSDWVDDWQERPYALADLATDAVAILDSLDVAQAHVIGVSMGGMVAQEFAINNPDRVLTLNVMMSSGNIVDEDLPPISSDITFNLVKIALKYSVVPTERNTIKLHVASRMILRGAADYEVDVREIAEQVLYNLRKRQGYNPGASQQHQEAVFRSGSRYEDLAALDIPTLIIHGVNDPFIPIAHSEKLAGVIPDARANWFENMGHDIPSTLIDSVVTELVANFERNPG